MLSNQVFQPNKLTLRNKKVDKSNLQRFKIIIAIFQVLDKFDKAFVFKKLLLLVDINIKIVLKISFFTFSNIDI